MRKTTLHAFLSACRYEFSMQIRRPTLWILLAAVGVLRTQMMGLSGSLTDPPFVFTAERTQQINLFMAMIFGIVLANRLPRDRQLHIDELLTTLPTGSGPRLWGKYLGNILATAVPTTLVYLMLASLGAMSRHDGSVFLYEIPAFLAIVVPALCFVGAFTLACTAFLSPVVYSVLFIGYWIWGNIVRPQQMPTLDCTFLTPAGTIARVGLLGGGSPAPSCPGEMFTAQQGWTSLAALMGTALFAMLAVHLYQRSVAEYR